MNEKKLYETKLLARLNVWSAEIENLKIRAELADADMRVAAEDKIIELRARQQLAHDKLDELSTSSDDTWHHLKPDVSAAANSLSQTLRSMRTRM